VADAVTQFAQVVRNNDVAVHIVHTFARRHRSCASGCLRARSGPVRPPSCASSRTATLHLLRCPYGTGATTDAPRRHRSVRATSKQGGDGIFSIEGRWRSTPITSSSTHTHSLTKPPRNWTTFWPQFRAFVSTGLPRAHLMTRLLRHRLVFNMPAVGLPGRQDDLPELFKDIDLDAEARSFYKTFFHIDRDRMLAAQSVSQPPEGAAAATGH